MTKRRGFMSLEELAAYFGVKESEMSGFLQKTGLARGGDSTPLYDGTWLAPTAWALQKSPAIVRKRPGRKTADGTVWQWLVVYVEACWRKNRGKAPAWIGVPEPRPRRVDGEPTPQVAVVSEPQEAYYDEGEARVKTAPSPCGTFAVVTVTVPLEWPVNSQTAWASLA